MDMDIDTADRRLHLVVISAGISVPSSTRGLADRLTAATIDALAAHGHTVDTAVIEVRDIAHAIVDATLTHFPSGQLAEAITALSHADGLIAVTPIYNLSYSGLFKALVDVIEPGTLAGVPTALGATGGSARHSLAIDYAMRPMFAYLKADIVPTTVFAATEDFGAPSTAVASDSLTSRAARVGIELADYMLRYAGVQGGAVAPTRANSTTNARPGASTEPPRGRTTNDDEFADFVPMETLLKRP